MRLLKAIVTNFASYSDLEFSFDNVGLSLIYGPTGSGKSTLQDIATWILYGLTAKGGNSDEVLSWCNHGKPTYGTISVETNSGIITVTRIRGKSSENDLSWVENGNSTSKRGKDIIETQKLLEERLGVSKETYLSGAQYNEFSPSGSFFTAKAKDRRELFENLADLSLPVKLAERITDAKRETKKAIVEGTAVLNQVRGELKQLERNKENTDKDVEEWRRAKKAKIEDFDEASKNFEEMKSVKLKYLESMRNKVELDKKEELESLNTRLKKVESEIQEIKSVACPTCGRTDEDESAQMRILLRMRTLDKIANLQKTVNPFSAEIAEIKASINTFQEKIIEESQKPNPFMAQRLRLTKELDDARGKENGVFHLVTQNEHHFSSLAHLYDLSMLLRGELIKNVAKDIEIRTNKYLEDYFDAEIRVQFDMEKDNLSVLIFKNGHNCVFTQLSKGQRCLLKLCFSVTVMKAVANKAGIHFGAIMFDEALDGLDTDLKLRAFGLLSELEKEHESVLVIDHSTDLQNLFEKQYRIYLVNDESVIHEES